MDKFITHKGIAAPLIRNNVDTDAIIPSREMKTVSKLGLSDGLFAAWRYTDESNRVENPQFVLNLPEYKNASILIGGNNFGCGSSREHAVWALKEYGFKCIIAQSFGAIFYRNCIANGLLAISLEASQIEKIIPANAAKVTIDLAQQQIVYEQTEINFDINANDKHVLLNGLDPISETLLHQSSINSFAQRDKAQRPWMYPRN